MKIDKSKIKAIAIGRFDGLHLAHFELIKRLGENGALVIIKDSKPKLTPKREDYLKIPCFYYKIEDIKHLSGEEFIQILKDEFVNLEKIVVGYDFEFGFNRAWKAKNIKEFFKGEVEIVDEFFLNKVSVHSKLIRSMLESGDIKGANELLGRKYFIKGEVVKGQGLGAKELFATLNLDVKDYFLPKEGVYATRCMVNNKAYKSVSFIGHRVSTDGEFSIETHILDDFCDVMATEAKVEFVKFIRDNAKFTSLKALKEQIKSDIAQAKQALESEN
ncbi:bifunctional riboflavin kinase/FAD synthetase [Campylobacter geochelonis]|uniref:Riboflavin biosynthesis protein n=1 Tax=Campylobacter geochelonis TaxID=1780362 RepID=A0A128EFH3_9BACT|nr:bifunctional riboflavin kinase/FAD synthetase [Campylobacter geochelonis]QKF71033.1 bifunctional riboflavin kinase / FMN adenylyltransferase [Campylobacter geochelonis]CZE47193.1 bifunctional riboflavin kinase/FMN adenylyltransferase [Campylobacter geochelonis]CZE47669.1 bifunctional riboflavin kinase/FMN adenylyltransferase [Campylobacter geochelonis]